MYIYVYVYLYNKYINLSDQNSAPFSRTSCCNLPEDQSKTGE